MICGSYIVAILSLVLVREKQNDRPPTFRYIVQVVINYQLFYRNIQCFTMAMPFNMILTLYVIPCKLSCDFSKLTILYIHVHIFYHFYDVNKYLSI